MACLILRRRNLQNSLGRPSSLQSIQQTQQQQILLSDPPHFHPRLLIQSPQHTLRILKSFGNVTHIVDYELLQSVVFGFKG